MVQDVTILIKSIFQSQGVQQASSQLKQLNKATQQAQQQLSGFRKLQGMGNMAAETQKANEFLDRFNAKLGKGGSLMRKDGTPFNPAQWKKVGASISSAIAQGDFSRFESSIEKSNRQMQEQAAMIENVRSRMGGYRAAFERGTRAGTTMTEKIKFGLTSMSQHFDMAMLSAMFFGMQIMNIGRRMGTTLISTFTDIAGANNKAVQSLNHLKAGFTVLKFTIGEALAQALMPLIPSLLNIIDKIIRWVEENPELTKTLLAAAAAATALGTALFIIAQTRLGLAGLAGTGALLIPGKKAAKEGAEKAGKTITETLKSHIAKKFPKGLFATLAKKSKQGLDNILNAIKNSKFGKSILTPIKSGFNRSWAVGKGVFTKMSDYLASKLPSSSGKFGKALSAVAGKAGKIHQWFGKIGARVTPVIGQMLLILDIIDITGNLFSWVTDWVNKWLAKLGVVGDILRIIWNVVTGILNLIRIAANLIWTWIVNGFKLVVDWVSKFFDKLTGSNTIIGKIADGIGWIADKTQDWVSNTDDVADAIRATDTLEGANKMLREGRGSKNPMEDTTKKTSAGAKKAKDDIDALNQSTEEGIRAQQDMMVAMDGAGDIDTEKINQANTSFKEFAKTITKGTENTPGVINALEQTADRITGGEGVNSAISLWIDRMQLAASTIVDTFIPQIEAAAASLEKNASAANSAASAQREYNEAVRGEE